VIQPFPNAELALSTQPSSWHRIAAKLNRKYAALRAVGYPNGKAKLAPKVPCLREAFLDQHRCLTGIL